MFFFPDPLTSEKSSLHGGFVGQNPERITSVFKLTSYVSIKTHDLWIELLSLNTNRREKKRCESQKLNKNGIHVNSLRTAWIYEMRWIWLEENHRLNWEIRTDFYLLILHLGTTHQQTSDKVVWNSFFLSCPYQ